MVVVVLWSIAIVSLAYTLYKWVTFNNDFFEKRNIKYMKPTFFFGNFGGVFLKKYSAADFGQKMYTAFANEP